MLGRREDGYDRLLLAARGGRREEGVLAGRTGVVGPGIGPGWRTVHPAPVQRPFAQRIGTAGHYPGIPAATPMSSRVRASWR